ncbi:MAG: DUF2829 domain-containing protein [Chitinophagia bacterium]|nr:DUF2829 domain-containing protein [Chitinophagia bacterium]
MDFSAALVAIKEGKRVQRSGWNGKGQFVETGIFSITIAVITTTTGTRVPWVPSQSDLFAEDWVEVKNGQPVEQAQEPVQEKTVAPVEPVQEQAQAITVAPLKRRAKKGNAQ